MDYYSHCVFEFTTDSLGAQSTILAGGRYDKLIGNMGGADTPGVGWAAGIERLMLLTNAETSARPLVAVIPMVDAGLSPAIELCYKLRTHDISCELVDSGNLSKRFKKADKMKAELAIIISEQELANGAFALKNLKTGEQTEVSSKDILAHISELFKP